MTTRILQISDLHIGRGDEEDMNFSVIVDDIVEKGGGKWKKNKPLIMITGDLVNDGTEAQFIHAKNCLNQLSSAGFTLRLIPGNHDYGKNGNDANEESFNLYKKYLGHFHKMQYPLCESPNNQSPLNGHFLVGINSMEVFTESNFAEGRLGEQQINKVCQFLKTHKNRPSNQKMIVYLHHHPFIFPDDGFFRRLGEHFGHRLEDGKNFMERIKKLNVDMLLFGHEHRHLNFTKTKLADNYNISYILSSGKSTEASYEYPVNTNGMSIVPSSIKPGLIGRLIEINDNNGKIIVKNEIFEDMEPENWSLSTILCRPQIIFHTLISILSPK